MKELISWIVNNIAAYVNEFWWLPLKLYALDIDTTICTFKLLCIDTHMYYHILEYNVCTKEGTKTYRSRYQRTLYIWRKKLLKDNYKIMSTSFILSWRIVCCNNVLLKTRLLLRRFRQKIFFLLKNNLQNVTNGNCSLDSAFQI